MRYFGNGISIVWGGIVWSWELRTGVHGCAEARFGGGGALNSDDEQIFAPKCVLGVLEVLSQEYAVLDGDGSQFAGSRAEDSKWLCGRSQRAVGGGEVRLGREEEFLPRVGTEVVLEEFCGGGVWEFG